MRALTLHSDDRERVERAVARALDPSEAREYNVEFRIVVPPGEIRWVAARGRALFNDVDGKLVAIRFLGTSFDITVRKRAEEERERLLAEVRDSLQVRDDFVSVASHELRSPLTALSLGLSSVGRTLRTCGDDPKIASALAGLEKAQQKVASIDRLMDALVDTARIRSGQLILHREPCSLSDVVGEMASAYRDQIAHKGCQLVLELEPLLVGEWDRLRLEQVIANLLTNAARYGCSSGGTIEVETLTVKDRAQLTVRDSGPGVPRELQEKLFDRFERGARTTGPGLGIGLWITRQIVEAHGGSIRLESEPGKGASFIVNLPLSPP